MTISSQDYAALADFSYGRDATGKAVDIESLVGKTAEIGGVKYSVIAYTDKPSGYQGAIFQRFDTGEVVVAHRGTEFERELAKDLVVADGKMVVQRTNVQANDAIELTREAADYARRYGQRYNSNAPNVTVTGHSLGGTLAQVSAHYFGLKGETFNAYGAASLNLHHSATGQFYRIPKGGNAVINHVMAADLVSSASPQYGQVRIYANHSQIDTLRYYGYENDPGWFDARADVPAAVSAMRGGSHDMHNFLPFDGDHRPDVSVIGNPDARRLAQQYAPMIDKFRHDIAIDRGAITVATRSLQGWANDARLMLHDPLPAGEPARIETRGAHPKAIPHPARSQLDVRDIEALPTFLSAPAASRRERGDIDPQASSALDAAMRTPPTSPASPSGVPGSTHASIDVADVTATAPRRDLADPPGILSRGATERLERRTADMRDPAHPAHPRYLEIYAGVVEIDRARGRTPDACSENLAAALTSASTHLGRVAHVVLSEDGRRAFAVDTANLYSEARQIAHVDVGAAVVKPVDASTRDWQQAMQQDAMQALLAMPAPVQAVQRGPALA